MTRTAPAPRHRFRVVPVAALLGLVALSYQGHARSDGVPPLPLTACSETCDHHASDCTDACEEKFKDDKPRIQCKLTCIAQREKCATACR